MDILKRIIGWNYNDGVALQAESGRNVYEDNNPLEFNEQGDLIEKTAEELGIITEYEQICGQVVQNNLLARREELNKARAKFCLESLAGYSHYNQSEGKALMNVFATLDDNSDYLVDHSENLFLKYQEEVLINDFNL